MDKPELTDKPKAVTILVVDDEKMIRTIVSRILQTLGYQVLLAESGAQSLEILQERDGEIDLVLLDLSMPVMGGIECFHHLRELNSSLKILVCTGRGETQEVHQLLADGAVGTLNKPFTISQIDAKIASAISPS